MWTQLFRRKDAKAACLDLEAVEGHHQLAKSLNLFDLVCFGIAAIVGAGIFSTIGTAAAAGGPAVIFLFILTAVACLFSALCYAEFAARVPVSGSAYTYAYVAFGELIAWVIGWALLMEYAVGNSVVAFSWSEYFSHLMEGFSIDLPAWIESDYFSCATAARDHAHAATLVDLPALLTATREVQEKLMAGMDVAGIEALDSSRIVQSAKELELDPDRLLLQNHAVELWNSAPNLGGVKLIMDLPALAINILVTALVYIGIKESKTASNLMVVLKVGVVLVVILVGAFFVKPSNWSPFAPNGLSGVLQGVAAVFFAYIGFDAISTTAEECHEPQRDLPRATILTLVVCTCLYVAVALVLTGMVSYRELAVSDPLAFVFDRVDQDWIAGPIALSAIVAITSVFLVFQIGQPRIWMCMARDGLLPQKFAKVHPKFKTPAFATIVTGIVVGLPILFLNQSLVTDLCSIGTLFAFMLVSAGVLKMELDQDHEPRPSFRVPFINSQWFVLTLWIAYTIAMFVALPQSHNAFFGLQFANIPYIVFYAVLTTFMVTSFYYRFSLIPVLGVLSNLYLISSLGLGNWIGFTGWLVVGLVVYFSYGFWNSRLRVAT